ncbi:MAG: hypothetical protein KatS3mg096_791 [Candidatus Parcubacteria bacterium]|nr:MAG: hypothetical protein KatS3mg096_791 [Candidatus Parcubacteria bacterium]
MAELLLKMPYLAERLKFKLPTSEKRNRKLTDEQIEEIKELYSQGYAIRQLARIYGVDKEAIKWWLFPEKRERQYLLRKLRGANKYHKKYAIYRRNWRKHRKEFFEKQLEQVDKGKKVRRICGLQHDQYYFIKLRDVEINCPNCGKKSREFYREWNGKKLNWQCKNCFRGVVIKN